MFTWIGDIDFSWAEQYRKDFTSQFGFELWIYRTDIINGANQELFDATSLEF